MVEVFGVDDGARIAAALAIRFPVFVAEQGVPAAEEIDEHDRDDALACHALVRDPDGTPIAAGRWYPLDAETVRIGRMAVARARRGAGAGRTLLEALVAEARRRGYSRATLHAQDHAVGFYAKAGFIAAGATVVECAIVHQPMERALS